MILSGVKTDDVFGTHSMRVVAGGIDQRRKCVAGEKELVHGTRWFTWKVTAMPVTLKDEQERQLRAYVEQGRFASIDDAAQHLMATALAADAVGDLDWTKPYLDEAEADIRAGHVVPLDNHLARVRQATARRVPSLAAKRITPHTWRHYLPFRIMSGSFLLI
jgi:Arc/MetJ-type ribon-helix-helix transcriptional regulator